MKKLLLGVVLTGLVGASVVALPAQAAESGLSATVYTYPQPGVPQRNASLYPVCTTNGVITQVQTLEDLFGAPYQEVLIGGCAYDYVLVHLTGYITLNPGTYYFDFEADDGLYLSIGGQVLTSETEDWKIKPPGGSKNVPFVVSDFSSLSVDYWFFDNEFGSYADVLIRDAAGNEVSQQGIFNKSPRVLPPKERSYEGPLYLKISELKQLCLVRSWQISGQRLASIESISVAGQSAKIVSRTNSLIEFEIPAGVSAGMQRVEISVPDSGLVLVENIQVPAAKNCLENKIKVTGFGLGSAEISSAGKEQISTFVSASGSTITCVGSSLASESSNPRALARARAQAACSVAKSSNPNLKVVTFITVLKTSATPGVTLKLG